MEDEEYFDLLGALASARRNYPQQVADALYNQLEEKYKILASSAASVFIVQTDEGDKVNQCHPSLSLDTPAKVSSHSLYAFPVGKNLFKVCSKDASTTSEEVVPASLLQTLNKFLLTGMLHFNDLLNSLDILPTKEKTTALFKKTSELLKRHANLQEAAALQKKLKLNETHTVLFEENVMKTTPSITPSNNDLIDEKKIMKRNMPLSPKNDLCSLPKVQRSPVRATRQKIPKSPGRNHHSMMLTVTDDKEVDTPVRRRRSLRRNSVV